MMRGLLQLLCVMIGAFMLWVPAFAAIYRCTSPNGPIRFSDQPCGAGAEKMNLGVAPLSEFKAEPRDRRAQVPKKPEGGSGVHITINNNINNAPRKVPPAEKSLSTATRGLPLTKYRRIEDGMSEGEVLAIAGPPDRKTVDARNTYSGIIQRSFYYRNTGYNAYVTRIVFRNGQVVRMRRTPILP